MTKIIEPKAIFISSTFRDMQSERDVLRDIVLPKVNEEAARYGTHIEFIDLRWGVDTADLDTAAQNHKVLYTCLDEIERSRPFFIGILGDRYGWVPDEQVIDEAVKAVEYNASTLKQSVTALEMEFGALRAPTSPVCLFYLRKISDYSALDNDELGIYEEADKEKRKLLTQLKADIKSRFGSDVKEYEAKIENGEASGLTGFAQMLTKDIIAKLHNEWGEPPEILPSDNEREDAALEQFIRGRVAGFVGRERVVGLLRSFCLDDNNCPIMLVQAQAGCGKSALLCRVMNIIRSSKENRDILLLPFACGITPRSSRVEDMFRFWIWKLETYLGIEGDESAQGFHELKNRFFGLLYEANERDIKVVAISDALDRLTGGDEVRSMLWITGDLPANFKLLCSIIDGSEIEAVKNMGGMVYPVPVMDDNEIIDIIHASAKRYHKQISAEVAEHIMRKEANNGQRAAQNPLYLKMLVQDLAMLNRSEHAAIDKYAAENSKTITPMGAINRFMKIRIDETPPDAEGAFIAIAERIDKLIGNNFAMNTLCMIAASRTGLRECDIESAFKAMDKGFCSADFSWLRQLLRGHFVQGGELQWNFAHESLRRALWRYCKDNVMAMNKLIAQYFYEDLSVILDDIRNREVLYHLYLQGWAEKAAKVIIECDESYLHYYIDALADIHVLQRNSDNGDFLLDILGAAEKDPDDIRFRAAMACGPALLSALPYGTPDEYKRVLTEKALELSEPFSEKYHEAMEISMNCYRLLPLYLKSKKDALSFTERAVLAYERMFHISEDGYYLIDLIASIIGYIRELFPETEFAEKLYEQRQKLDVYCDWLHKRINKDEFRDDFIPMLTLSNGWYWVIKALKADPQIPAATQEHRIVEFIKLNRECYEGFKKINRYENAYDFLAQIHSGYDMLGDLYNNAGDSEKAEKAYRESVDAIRAVYENMGRSRDLEKLIYAYHTIGIHYFNCEKYDSAYDVSASAFKLCENLFEQYSSIKTASYLSTTLSTFVPAAIMSGHVQGVNQHAVLLYALYSVLDRRGRLSDAKEKLGQSLSYIKCLPPLDENNENALSEMFRTLVEIIDERLTAIGE